MRVKWTSSDPRASSGVRWSWIVFSGITVGFLLSFSVGSTHVEVADVQISADSEQHLYPTGNVKVVCNANYNNESDRGPYVFDEKKSGCVEGKYTAGEQQGMGFNSWEDCMATCVWRCPNGWQPYTKNDHTKKSNKFELPTCDENGKRCAEETMCVHNTNFNDSAGFCCPYPGHQCNYEKAPSPFVSSTSGFFYENNECKKGSSSNYYRMNNLFVDEPNCTAACIERKDYCDHDTWPWVGNGTVYECTGSEDKTCRNEISGALWYCSFKKQTEGGKGHCCPGRGLANYTKQVTTPAPTTSTTTIPTTTESTTVTTTLAPTTILTTTVPPTTRRRRTTTTTSPPRPATTAIVGIPGATKKKKTSKHNLGVTIGATVGGLGLLVIVLLLSGFCLYRRNKQARQRDEAEAAQRNAHRIAKFQAEQKAKTPKRALRGQVVPGLPPPGPPGWEPDQISARRFKHMGPLKMEQKPSVVMVHEMENDEIVVLGADQHVEFDDDQNLVYDIGSEVEEVYRDGRRVVQPKRRVNTPAQRPASRRTAEPRNLKAIRED